MGSAGKNECVKHHLSIVIGASLLMSTGVAGNLQGAKASEVSWVIKVLNKPRKDVEAVLGKPTKTLHKGSEYNYGRKGFRNLGVMYSEGGRLMVLEVEFVEQPADWKAALKSVGIDSAKVEAKFTGHVMELKGISGMPSKWEAFYMAETTIEIGEKVQVEPAKLSFYSPDAS